MEITILGFVLLPIGFWLLFQKSWKFLFHLFVFFVPFSASAVINFSSFGIQPSIFLGLLIIARIILSLIIKFINRNKISKITKDQVLVLCLFWIFIIFVIMSILTIPFDGTVIISRPSGDDGLLKITVENFTQFLYLLYFISFVTIISICKFEEFDFKEVLMVLTISSIFVCLWGWMQVASFRLGFTYPDFLFNNNNSGKQSYGQVIKEVSIKRMNSVLQEPSRMARFMLVPTFIYLYQAIYKPDLLFKKTYITFSLLIFFSFTLFFTTSSTAFVSFGFGILFLILIILWKNYFVVYINFLEIRRIFFAFQGYILAFLIVLIIVMQILGLTFEDLIQLMNVVIFNKLDSNSAEDRIGTIVSASDLFYNHPILGVGWGSNRANSFLTNLLANTGVLGLGSFLIANATLFFLVLKRVRMFYKNAARQLSTNRGRDNNFAMYTEIFVFSLSIITFCQLISQADYSLMDQWLLLGLMISSLRVNFSQKVSSDINQD